MKHFIILIFSIFIFFGCSAKNSIEPNIKKDIIKEKINKLSYEIQSMSDSIDKEEAYNAAFNAVTYSKYLAQKYKAVKPAIFNNLLINLHIKNRGLCYHYANDLFLFLRSKNYKSFKLMKIISNRDEYFEHTSLAIIKDGVDLKNSIVLDAWRDVGELYFSKIKDDKRYKWEEK